MNWSYYCVCGHTTDAHEINDCEICDCQKYLPRGMKANVNIIRSNKRK